MVKTGESERFGLSETESAELFFFFFLLEFDVFWGLFFFSITFDWRAVLLMLLSEGLSLEFLLFFGISDLVSYGDEALGCDSRRTSNLKRGGEQGRIWRGGRWGVGGRRRRRRWRRFVLGLATFLSITFPASNDYQSVWYACVSWMATR